MEEIKKIVAETIISANDRNAENEQDYIDKETGLLFCGKCHTRKQTYFLEMKVGCLCECEKEVVNERDRQYKLVRKAKELEKMRDECLSKNKWKDYTFDKALEDKTDPIFRTAMKYARNWKEVREKNIGIVFYGLTGRGKSFYGACIANYLINKGIRVYVRTENELLNEYYSSENKEEYIDFLSSVPLLIIDDFGNARRTSYANEVIKQLIDCRYNSGKPLILTTNYSKEDFDTKTLEQERICERIKETCVFVEVKGENIREKLMEETRKSFLDIFNRKE